MYKKKYINKSYKAEGEEKRAFDEAQWGEADVFSRLSFPMEISRAGSQSVYDGMKLSVVHV